MKSDITIIPLEITVEFKIGIILGARKKFGETQQINFKKPSI